MIVLVPSLVSSVTGKIAAGAAGLAVVTGGISWWRMDDASRQAAWSAIGDGAAWLAVVLLLPWATFALIGRVAKSADTNVAGGLLVAAYTLLEAGGLAWLIGTAHHGRAGWIGFVAAVLLAAVYNVLVCDWIAERVT